MHLVLGLLDPHQKAAAVSDALHVKPGLGHKRKPQLCILAPRRPACSSGSRRRSLRPPLEGTVDCKLQVVTN